jgi:hypothetical protein
VDHFRALLENNRLCLLVYGPHMYSLIPKRAFKSEAELEAFRALVSAKIDRGKNGACQRAADDTCRSEAKASGQAVPLRLEVSAQAAME